MNADSARTLLALHRPDRDPDARMSKAIRFAESDQELKKSLTQQTGFDQQVIDVIRHLRPPENLEEVMDDLAAKAPTRRSTVRQALNPAILCAILGAILLLGFGVYTMMEAEKNFPGREWTEDFINLNNQMRGDELEATNVPAGELADNLMLRGFDDFALPPEIAKLPAVGWRVFRHGQSGHKVVQLAIDRNRMVAFVFRSADFGVQPQSGSEWRVYRHAEWAAAIKEHGKLCVLLTLQGSESEMRTNLRSLNP